MSKNKFFVSHYCSYFDKMLLEKQNGKHWQTIAQIGLTSLKI